jgi:hypothetical protein
MARVIIVTLVLTLTIRTARAEPYWVEWTGDAYPETEGWIRGSSDPPAERWLEDGKLFIDSRADWFIYEQYGQPRPGMMTTGPGETFIMHWRVKVDEIIGVVDPGIIVRSDDQHAVVFNFSASTIESFYEPGVGAPFEAGQFHEFTLESADMRAYSLSIDGEVALEGAFYKSIVPDPMVAWGDIASHRSLSEWDSVGFGIVPEPASALYLLAVCTLRLLRRSATT